MRNPKEIAIAITKGDHKAKSELEKMLGKKFDEMTIEERRFGCAVLSGTESYWNKQEK